MTLHRIAHWLHKKKVPLLPKMIYVLQYLVANSMVPPSVQIGPGTIFAYRGIGLVIHKRSVIGANCTIGQGITIGGRSKQYEVPVIGDNVYMGPGCRILGPIKIGDNVIIGPNSVVLHDVPSNSIVVGIPGKVIKTGIKVEDYL
jgi:serine O-acetyltransferase